MIHQVYTPPVIRQIAVTEHTSAHTSTLGKALNTAGNTSASLTSTLPEQKSFLWDSQYSKNRLSGSSISAASSESSLASSPTSTSSSFIFHPGSSLDGSLGYGSSTSLDSVFEAVEQRPTAPTPPFRRDSDPAASRSVSNANLPPLDRSHTAAVLSDKSPVALNYPIDSIELGWLRNEVMDAIKDRYTDQLNQLSHEYPAAASAINYYIETYKTAVAIADATSLSLSEKKNALASIYNTAPPENISNFTSTVKKIAVAQTLMPLTKVKPQESDA